MRFPSVIQALQNGTMAKRINWPEGTFIFRQVPSTIDKDIVPKMTSLPEAVKEEFQRRFEDESLQVASIYYSHQFAKVDNSNLITSYNASTEDIESDDWVILK